jgi:hypothetical protein
MSWNKKGKEGEEQKEEEEEGEEEEEDYIPTIILNHDKINTVFLNHGRRGIRPNKNNDMVDISTLKKKPWSEPGADRTHYFNYGFNEETWKIYVEKQKKNANKKS